VTVADVRNSDGGSSSSFYFLAFLNFGVNIIQRVITILLLLSGDKLTSFPKEKSNYVRALLRAKGETVVTLSSKINRPWSTLNNTINGLRSNKEVRKDIANFLGKDVDVLFGESEIQEITSEEKLKMKKLKSTRKIYSSQEFVSRIFLLMEEAGFKNYYEFDAAIGTKGAVSRWINGTNPRPANLIKIKNKFNILIDWLLTGEGAMRLSESCFKTHDTRQLAPVETDKIANLITIIEDYLIKANIKISADRKGRLVSMLYEYWATKKESPDNHIIDKYLPLTYP
jgi:hypothetical protein